MDASKVAVLAVVILLALVLARSDEARAFAFRHHDPASGAKPLARSPHVRCEDDQRGRGEISLVTPTRQP